MGIPGFLCLILECQYHILGFLCLIQEVPSPTHLLAIHPNTVCSTRVPTLNNTRHPILNNIRPLTYNNNTRLPTYNNNTRLPTPNNSNSSTTVEDILNNRDSIGGTN